MRDLQEVLVELNRQNQAKQDFISPAQGMRLREDGHTFEINHLNVIREERKKKHKKRKRPRIGVWMAEEAKPDEGK